jgi:hypothetical protein
MNKLALIFFFGLASADISLQVFDQGGCQGNVANNIHSNLANPQDSSGCIAPGQYSSIGILTADPGFQCNLYSDAECQNFLTDASTAGVCTEITGNGVICFSQALFDNPFAESTAEVTLGLTLITVDLASNTLVYAAVSAGCGANGCDPTTPFTKSFDHFNKDCTLSVSMEGNYDSTNQRDYMSGLLQSAMEAADTNFRQDLTGSSEDNDDVLDTLSFSQVVISNTQSGANEAQMSVTVTVDCAPSSLADCQSLLDQVTTTALGAVPGVGGILASAFSVVCQNSG